MPSASVLGELRDQLERLRAQLEALPTAELEHLDALDTRARAVDRSDATCCAASSTGSPRHASGASAATRTRTSSSAPGSSSALAGAEDQLERTLTQRATLARELGDAAAIREERDGLTSAIDTLAHQHTDLRNHLAGQALERGSQWTRDALGERPEHPSAANSWDQAARTLARYRIDYEITEGGDWLGTRPADPQQRHDYDRAVRAYDQLAHHRERETVRHELDFDL